MIAQGNRVYLTLPDMQEYKVELSPEFKKELQAEIVSKLDRLTVYAVGNTVKNVKVGDEVFVDPLELKRATVVNVEGKERIIVPSYGISHVW